MKLREASSRGATTPRPIHRIMWESVLYQMMRQTANRPFATEYEADVDFCALADVALQSLAFPDASPADNSPVIGFPVALQKLIVDIVQVCKGSVKPEAVALERLSIRLRWWESTILEEGHCSREESWSTKTAAQRSRLFHQHSTSLHVLAASILLNWVLDCREVADTNSQLPTMSDVWQLRRGFEILRCPHASEEWSKCYLGSWPTLIFGYVVDEAEDMAFIRNDLKMRYWHSPSGEVLLFLDELEYIWRLRGIAG